MPNREIIEHIRDSIPNDNLTTLSNELIKSI